MVQTPVAAPTSPVIQPADPVAFSAVSDASIAAYIAAGERMRILSSWVGVIGVGLLLIIAATWALGVLPVAVKLF